MIDLDCMPQIKEFVRWAHKVGEYELVRCSSGNLSCRMTDDTILVSESRSWLSNLKKKQVAQVSINDGSIIKGNRPTGELPLHLAIMRRNPGINAILHCQSTSATTIACLANQDINYNVVIEVPIYIGNIQHIPYMKPGSQDLADAVAQATDSATIIQMQNHGQVVIGKSLEDVVQKAVFFELACNIMLNSKFNYTAINSEQINLLQGYR